MKNKRLLILGAVILVIGIVVAAVTQVPKWSEKSFEAVVGERKNISLKMTLR